MPVLSTTTVSMSRMRSIASALRNRMPARAPCPMATVIEMGVASPTAQGQAMISTAMAFRNAYAISAPGRRTTTRRAVTMAMATTICTKYAAMTSASRWIGARVRCASPTICTIRASRVSEPTRSARMIEGAVAVHRRAGHLVARRLGHRHGLARDHGFVHPARALEHLAVHGHFLAGLHAQAVADATVSSGTCSSVPSSRTRQARLGASSKQLLIAWLVWPIARNCSTSPSITSVTITAAASK